MRGNTYTLFLNSANLTNQISNPSKSDITYYVNWENLLPSGVDKFDLDFTFKSAPLNASIQDSILIYASLNTTTKMYENGVSSSTLLGAVVPKSYVAGTNLNYFESFYDDDMSLEVYRPTGELRVRLNTFSGATFNANPNFNYILQLCFTEII